MKSIHIALCAVTCFQTTSIYAEGTLHKSMAVSSRDLQMPGDCPDPKKLKEGQYYVSAPLDYAQASDGRFNLYYDVSKKWKKAQPTVFLILDGEQFRDAAGAADVEKESLQSQKVNVVYIEPRGHKCSPIAGIDVEKSGGWEKAWRIYNFQNYIDDIETVRDDLQKKNLLPTSGKISLMGRYGGGELILHYAAKYPQSLEKAILAHPYLDMVARRQANQKYFMAVLEKAGVKNKLDQILNTSTDEVFKTQLMFILHRIGYDHKDYNNLVRPLIEELHSEIVLGKKPSDLPSARNSEKSNKTGEPFQTKLTEAGALQRRFDYFSSNEGEYGYGKIAEHAREWLKQPYTIVSLVEKGTAPKYDGYQTSKGIVYGYTPAVAPLLKDISESEIEARMKQLNPVQLKWSGGAFLVLGSDKNHIASTSELKKVSKALPQSNLIIFKGIDMIRNFESRSAYYQIIGCYIESGFSAEDMRRILKKNRTEVVELK